MEVLITINRTEIFQLVLPDPFFGSIELLFNQDGLYMMEQHQKHKPDAVRVE